MWCVPVDGGGGGGGTWGFGGRTVVGFSTSEFCKTATAACVVGFGDPCFFFCAIQVYCNVYDLSPANDYGWGVGLGAFHSGIEVYGVEYRCELELKPGASRCCMIEMLVCVCACVCDCPLLRSFGSGGGVFAATPRDAGGAKFREAVLLGEVFISERGATPCEAAPITRPLPSLPTILNCLHDEARR